MGKERMRLLKKLKMYAILCCVVSFVFAMALGVTGFFLLGSYEAGAPNGALAFWFRFFFMTTPTIGIIALVTVARLKVREE